MAFGSALVKALAVSELNAAMGKHRSSADPLAPAESFPRSADNAGEHHLSEDITVRALFTASAIGMVIAQNASISGARRGSGRMWKCIGNGGGGFGRNGGRYAAAGFPCLCDCAEKYIGFGLRSGGRTGGDSLYQAECDGHSKCICSGRVGLAGIESAIPADEVIVAMKRIGDLLPVSLKETADGGLADTPTARKLQEQVFGKQG